MADLEGVKKKIRGLLDKTVSAGCTEAEATAAAATAARLMSDHGLTDDDLVMSQERVPGSSRPSPLDVLWVTLADVTECCLVRERSWSGSEFIYFGCEPKPTIAVYLHTYLHRTVEAAVRDFQKTPEYRRKRKGKPRRRACEAFREGMALRLRVTLVGQFQTPSREALQKAEQYRDQECGELSAGKARRQFGGRNDAARAAGARAGADVEIRSGLTGGVAGYLEG